MKRRIFLGAAVALGLSGLGYAQTVEPVTATEEPPIVQQVNDHEQRIGTLETKTGELEQRADDTDTAVQQLQTATEPSEPVTGSQTAATEPTAPVATSEPAPEPEQDPYYIVKVESTPEYLRDGSQSGHTCSYYLYARKIARISHGVTEPCFQAGTVLPGPYRQKLNNYTESW